MKTKKVLSVLLVAAMTTAMVCGCGSSDSKGDSQTAKATESDLAGTSITFLNSKGEIQEAMEDLAAEFTDETGIDVEVLACGTGEVPYTKVTSAYNSGNAPTMSMLDKQMHLHLPMNMPLIFQMKNGFQSVGIR